MTAEARAGFAPEALSRDAFLGGALHLLQPRGGYRAGIDPVLLAASVRARAGQSVLELGCGAGPALLCLGTRVPGLALTGIERQDDYAALARRNADENGIAAAIVTADLTALPADVRQVRFDRVIANPPYFESTGRTRAADAGREAGLAEETPLATWIEVAARRCSPGGEVTFIHRAERVPELLAGFCAHLGAVELQPLAPREGRPPRLVLARGRKGGRTPFRLHAPLVLHRGASHEKDGDDYAPEIEAVLRRAADLHFSA
ncbi:hypothetical protein ATO8_05916 [Roseivivax marinus]|uniref:Methyltransferase small domain-containing protein n=1 Tax=Roseivivax marinus TaxID=1379903 RepID=W4HLB1_9RHOB|nr:methyltransferase [Roseivivax marinus]ETW13542.1 hypothetical protein ATO8_05916 [Roseivivax marinus]